MDVCRRHLQAFLAYYTLYSTLPFQLFFVCGVSGKKTCRVALPFESQKLNAYRSCCVLMQDKSVIYSGTLQTCRNCHIHIAKIVFSPNPPIGQAAI